MDSTAKVALGPVLTTTRTDSSIENGKSAPMSSCEKSTESVFKEFFDICVLLNANLLEDVDACTKFVDSAGKMIHSDSFTKCLAFLRKSSLLATM